MATFCARGNEVIYCTWQVKKKHEAIDSGKFLINTINSSSSTRGLIMTSSFTRNDVHVHYINLGE